MQCLGNRHSNSTTYASADNADLLKSVKVCCHTERTYTVLNVFTCFLIGKLLCSAAYHLENNLDGTVFLIDSRNSKRNPLAILVYTKNDELSGFCFICH